MVRNFGFYDKEGNFNVYVAQFCLTWIILLVPFYVRPIDFLCNMKKYLISLPCYYFSYLWWFVIINCYSICNLDDVSWGNRPANASKGMNVVVDDKKRQEILKQSYRSTRTHILIFWLLANISLMYMFDAIILSAVHNGNVETKAICTLIAKIYCWYQVGSSGLVLSLSILHHITGNIYSFFSKYTPATIYKRPPVFNDPETKVLLDESDEENVVKPPILKKDKREGKNSNKSDFETIEDMSFFSDDLESQ